MAGGQKEGGGQGQKDMKREVGDFLRCPAPAPRLSPLSLLPLPPSALLEHNFELCPREARFHGALTTAYGALSPVVCTLQ